MITLLKSTLAGVLILGLFTGCASVPNAYEKYGKTYYLDGAGNWGYGVGDVPVGLRNARYKGHVEIYGWTTSFNPLIDQLNIPGARLAAAGLAGKINRYFARYPDNELNIIALSAGTGVATWAVENISAKYKINNLVLLGSSLSHDYNMTRALKHMKGNIYVYYSPYDSVLESVKVIGTIDGKHGVDSIGLVGLTPPPGYRDRVINVGYSRKFISLGWAGDHTSSTSRNFIQHEVARHIVTPKTRATREETRRIAAGLDPLPEEPVRVAGTEPRKHFPTKAEPMPLAGLQDTAQHSDVASVEARPIPQPKQPLRTASIPSKLKLPTCGYPFRGAQKCISTLAW